MATVGELVEAQITEWIQEGRCLNTNKVDADALRSLGIWDAEVLEGEYECIGEPFGGALIGLDEPVPTMPLSKEHRPVRVIVLPCPEKEE